MIPKLLHIVFFTFAALCITQTIHAQQFSISGNIVTSDDKPASQVNVQLAEINKTIATGPAGYFSFTGLAAGRYTVVCSYTGLATQTKHILLSADKPAASLKITLLENHTELKEIIVAAAISKTDKPVSLGKMDIKPMDLPQATAIIEKQLLERQQVQTLGDALQNMNGVYISGNTGGYQEEISSRGFAFGSNNTFKNGVRFNNSMMPEVNSLESIELLKGGNAILFGTVGAGGVLNLVTKKPKFNNGGSISIQTGSYGFYKPSVDVYGAINNSRHFAYRLNSSFTKAKSFRDVVTSERYHINPSLLIQVTSKTTILIEGDYTQDHRNLDYGTGAIYYKIAPTPRSLYLNLPWSYNKAEQMAGTATITHRLNDKWQLKAIAGTRKYFNELFGAARPNANSQFIDSAAANYGRWVRGLVKGKTEEHYHYASVDITGKFSTGKFRHTLLAGMDADRSSTDNYTFDYTNLRSDKKNIYDTINIFGTKQYLRRNDIPDVPWTFYTVAPLSRLGIYAQDFIELRENLKLLAGIRYSISKTSTSDSLYANGNKKLHSEFRTEDAFSPRIGIVFQPSKYIAVFTSYTNTYELNTAVDTFARVLPPSVIDQYELGIKTMLLNNKISINLTSYIINNNNAVQSYPNLAATDSRRESGGQTQSRGMELDIITKNIHGFSINAGYSYNDTRYVKSTLYVPGSKLRYNPNHTANIHVYYTVKPASIFGGLNAGLGAYYTGERVAGRSVTKANPNYALMPVPEYFLFETSIGYNWQHLSARIKLNNIFNQLSYNVHDDNSVNPVAPRQFTATLAYKF